jgi:hypothetical protein
MEFGESEQPVDYEIEEFLGSGYWVIAPERRATRSACANVLRRLPEAIADQVINLQRVILLAPSRGEWGRALPFSWPEINQPEPLPSIRVKDGTSERVEAPQATVVTVRFSLVYLSPDLEAESPEVIVAVTAHEIAHGITGQIIGEESELLADQTIREWGFGYELDLLREKNRNHRY